MATVSQFPRQPSPPQVDVAVDKKGVPPSAANDPELVVAGEHEDIVAATNPTSWWLYSLIALAIVVAIVLALQVFNGAPGSDVEPGTPTAAPVVEPVVPAAP